MDWQQYVESDPSLLRPTDIRIGRADAGKAARILGWKNQTDVDGVVDRMCEAASEDISPGTIS